MNQMSFKNVFCKILFSEKQREKMTSLKDVGSAYELFCKNGYSKSLDEFKVEMNNFLSSSDGQKIMNNNFDELSDEMLAMVAGGGANFKKVATVLTSGVMALSMITAPMASVGAAGNDDKKMIVQSKDSSEKEELEKQVNNKLQELKDVQKKIGELFKLKKGDNFAKDQMRALGACLNLHKELQNNFTVDVAKRMIEEADKVINEVNERINKNEIKIEEKKEIRDINQKVEKLKEAEKELATQSFKGIVDKERGKRLSRLIGLCYKLAEQLKNKYVAQQAKDFFYWNEEALKLIDELKKEYGEPLKEIEKIPAKYNEALNEIRESRDDYNKAKISIKSLKRRVLLEKIYSYIKLVDQYGKLDEYTKITYERLKIEYDKMVEEDDNYVSEALLGAENEEQEKAVMSPEKKKLYELDKIKQSKDFFSDLINDLKETIDKKAKKLEEAQKEFVQFTNAKNLTSANNENVKIVFSLIGSCNELEKELKNKLVGKKIQQFFDSVEEALEKIDKLKKEYAEKNVKNNNNQVLNNFQLNENDVEKKAEKQQLANRNQKQSRYEREEPGSHPYGSDLDEMYYDIDIEMNDNT